jgi:hypothetical protein
MLASRDVPDDGPIVLPTRGTTPAGARPADSATGPHRAGSRYVHGAVRTAGWIEITQIQCPREHHIKDGYISISEDTFRCKCGVLLWGLFVPRAHVVALAEVDGEDIRVIKTHNTIGETMRYLGFPMWPLRRKAA